MPTQTDPGRPSAPDLGFAAWGAVLLLLLALASPTVADEEAWPYPAGRTIKTIEGLKTYLHLPETLSRERPASLVIVLHSAGGSPGTMADRFEAWSHDGYVVCAPKAQDITWEPNDLKKIVLVATHLKTVLPIDPKKVHVVGYDQGGTELSPLAFHDELRPCSATWLTSGYRGHQVPRWAKTGLGACAIAGTDDFSKKDARATVKKLRGKVRNVEFHLQQGLGHAYPSKYAEYLRWWMGVQEGRLTPGDDRSFEWTTDLDAAIASQSVRKKGGVFVWVYSHADAESDRARTIQHTIFFHPEVRFLGRQIACVKLEAGANEERIAALGVKSAPALVVLDKKGKVKMAFQEEILAKKVARSLRGVAPRRTMPKH